MQQLGVGQDFRVVTVTTTTCNVAAVRKTAVCDSAMNTLSILPGILTEPDK